MDIFRFIFILWLPVSAVGGYNIIVLLPLAAISHKVVFMPVVEELASRGHQVTIISSVKQVKQNRATITDIVIPQVFEPFMTNLTNLVFGSTGFTGLLNSRERAAAYQTIVANSCKHFFQDSATKKLLKGGKQFDVAIVSEFFNDCALSSAYLLAKNVIHFSPSGQYVFFPTQAPSSPSYVPSYYLSFTANMSFRERLVNFIVLTGYKVWYWYFIHPVSQKMLTKYVPEAPTVYEAHKNVSFTILNTDSIYYTPRPSMRNSVRIGAVHCRSAQDLPKDFQEFVDSSGENGFLVFSFGSVVDSQFLPTDVIESFASAFKLLKQKVIWKHEGKIENLPDNVKLTKWIPQQDLLGHPKIRLFMTHGGLLSLEEALFHAVPVIGIPFFGDQWGNMARVRQLGIGERFDLKAVTTEAVYDVITKVLNDRRYAENVKKYSLILHDQIVNSLDLAVYWIEYVIRHEGAQHLRSSGADLNLFQYFLLDVMLFLAVIVIVTICIFALLINEVVRRICRRSKNPKLKIKAC